LNGNDFNQLLEELNAFLVHNHTDVSNLKLMDSTNKVKDLIEYAVKINLKGVAITDHECLSNHVKAIQIAKEINKKNKDFKVALGNEIYLVNSLEEVKNNYQSGITKFPHFILIAKDKEGHFALRKLSSKAWGNMFKTGKMDRVPLTTQELVDIVGQHKGHLIATSACLGGYIGIKFKQYTETSNQEHLNDIYRFVDACKFVFESDFYLELQPSFMNDQIAYNKFLMKLAETKDIKTIYSTDSHYLSKNHKTIHKAFLNSNDGDREVDDFYSSTYLMDTKEAWSYFKDYIAPEYFIKMINNTIEIYDKIEFYDLKQDTIVPPINIPPFNDKHELGELSTNKYEFIHKFYNSEHPIDRYMLFQCYQGFKNKNQSFNETNLSRLEEECKELWLLSEKMNQRMSSYYCLTKEDIDLMWTVSLVGIARGSTTGFYISYLLDISQMNPIKYNLPSWRHIHHSKYSLPDIDIDTSAEQRSTIIGLIKEKHGYDKVLNIATFKTLKPKLAIQVAGRGLGYNNDEIMAISDMIPIERGQQWSLKDCLEGNEEEDKKPLKELINILKEFPNLTETATELEGLIVGRSIHASGVNIYSQDYTHQTARMKAPNGEDITAFNLTDEEYCGALKLDLLTIEALDKIKKCMDLLIEDGKMEWKGSLRDTYNFYLHPDVIDYNSPEMYKLLYNGDVINAFQYEGMSGIQALNKIKPMKFVELVAGNSIMRLASKNNIEQPLDKYVRFKNDISLWYKEMKIDYGLTEEEVKVLENHLLDLYGVADTQEVAMRLAMDEHIGNFTFTDADKLRKGIGKKSKKVVEECREMFFEKGLANGTRQQVLDYVWTTQIQPMASYSFSTCHTHPYTGILIQEMNLAYYFGHMYWKCACLSVNAGVLGDTEDDDEEETNNRQKATDYGKIAKAVSEMNDIVDAPNINYSKEGFAILNSKILYGLRALSKVGKNDIDLILLTRPFDSYEDFMNKCGNQLTKNAVVNLIKCGALDMLNNANRLELMRKYIESICEYKDKFTMANIPMLIEAGIITKEYEDEIINFNIYKTVCTKSNVVAKDSLIDLGLKGEWYFVNDSVLDVFLDRYSDLRNEIDYINLSSKYIVKKTSIKNSLDKKIVNLNNLLSDIEVLKRYNQMVYEDTYKKYANGSIPRWEMDSMSYYKTEHELNKVDRDRYAIDNFFDLPFDPIVNETWINSKGKEFKRYKLSLIMGTVLDRDKTKHTVELLTPEGVVTCKLYDGAFNHYNKVISKIDNNGKKKRIEESWFKRGQMLLMYGFRMGDQFKPRKYSQSIFQHTVMRIQEIKDNGELVVQTERIKI
jgi:DNA polymerase-3 subunit alpha